MAAVVYILGTLTTLLCAVLLLRGYGSGRRRLLLWSGLCFVGLTISHAILFIDLVLAPPEVNLYIWRLSSAAIGMLLLVYGLVWESE